MLIKQDFQVALFIVEPYIALLCLLILQKAVLSSFVYNISSERFESSILLKKLKPEDIQGTCDQI
ncbi:MAG: glycoside hydrolase family protein [Arsenophonus sp. NC-TX2-MAG3]